MRETGPNFSICGATDLFRYNNNNREVGLLFMPRGWEERQFTGQDLQEGKSGERTHPRATQRHRRCDMGNRGHNMCDLRLPLTTREKEKRGKTYHVRS